MMNKQQHLLQVLQEKRLVKVIAGIDNVDALRVAMVVRAAQAAGADAVDVAATPEIVRLALNETRLPVMASSVDPEALAAAVAAGADAVEVGNFDALYAKGFYLTAEDVLDITRKTLALIPQGTPLSVTVPGHLSAEAQVLLARHLETLGVTMIQTEGASRVVSVNREVQLLSAPEKVQRTLDNTRTLAQAVSTPLLTASGLNADNVLQAFASGASAVGIGSAVNRLATEAEMVEVITAVMNEVKRLPAKAVAS